MVSTVAILATKIILQQGGDDPPQVLHCAGDHFALIDHETKFSPFIML